MTTDRTTTAAAMRAMAPHTPRTPAPASPPPPAPPVPAASARRFDRAAWERAVMASDLQPTGRALAFVLAHHAGPGGRILPTGELHGNQLGERAGLTHRQTTISFEALTKDRFIVRPARAAWDTRLKGPRPITLRMPVLPDEPPSTAEGA